jgi:DNA-binding GntR family transcriptional regulator
MAADRDARTLTDIALRELRHAILTGELQPGAPVRLQEQVDKLEMSSVPIREALRYLEQGGLVERSPHKGTRVAAASLDDLLDTYAVRVPLEALAVRAAAGRAQPDDAARLQARLAEYAAAARKKDPVAHELHNRLHMAIYELSGSRWLMRVLPMLWDNSERYRRMSIPVRGSVGSRIEEHARVVSAVADGDPDAAEQALRTHLAHTVEVARKQLRAWERGAGAGAG